MSAILGFILAASLLGLSALFSGMTIGLFALEPGELRRKMELGSKEAAQVYPIRARGNQLLVTLILGNVLVNSALTVVLNSVTVGIVAVIASTILITTFGEVLPAAFLNKHGLKFGAILAPYLNLLMVYTSPLTKPAALFLDRTIGVRDYGVYSKEELLKIMDEHVGQSSDIEDEDLSIAKHALSFADKHISDVMLPKVKMIALKEDDVISPNLLSQLHDSPDSSFPVYTGSLDNITGTLYLRDLIELDPKITKVHQVMDKGALYVNGNQTLDHALSAFLHTKHHLFVVIDDKEKTLGVVTIEDIIDEVIGNKFADKFNRHYDRKAVAGISGRVE